MRLLNELSLLQVRNLALITRLSGSKLSIRSSPIWSIGRRNNFTEGTLSNFHDSVNKIQTYAVEHPWRFYFHFFIYVAIVVISLNFKRQKQLWEQYRNREDEIKHVLHPLSNPYIASFLLALSFTSWVHFGAPGDFYDVVLILLPLPILFFLYQIRLFALLKEAILFSLVFSLIHIQHFIIFNSLFHRIALLFFSLLLLLAIRRIQKNYRGDYLKVFKYIFRVANYAIFLAILGNVFGYFEVSQFLISQISAGIIIAALFHISSYVITDIIKLFLLSERMQAVRSIRKNYGKIKLRTHQIIRWLAMTAWVIVLLKNSGFYNEAIDPFVDFLDKERSIGSVTYSIGGLFLFVFTIYLSTVLSSIIEEIFKEDLSSQKASQRRNVGALTIMVRYGVITIGLFMAVAFSGLPVENITIIIGALGVGIGFGLQNIFNNLVSGFILAVEKPIQIGDIVQVDSFMGEVQDIGIRASKVKTFDGAEVIIPNGDLIASNVINWTHSDRFRRIELFVGVAYGTDTEQVIELIKTAINRCELIKSYPEPIVVFHNFGDSSLDFRVLCWTSIESFLQGKSELSIFIDKLFKEHNISIPFPQRDLYIKSIDEIKMKEEVKTSENNLTKGIKTKTN